MLCSIPTLTVGTTAVADAAADDDHGGGGGGRFTCY